MPAPPSRSRRTPTILPSSRRGRARDFSAEATGDLVVRFAALPSRLPALAAAVAGTVRVPGTWRADALRGTLHVALATADAAASVAALAGLAGRHDAHLVVERWPLALTDTISVWHPLPAGLPLMRRVKRALDPTGVLAPGRFVGGI
jgi:glycolate oxidase FAD binding subunit